MSLNYSVIICACNPPKIFYDTINRLEEMQIDTFAGYSGNDMMLPPTLNHVIVIKEFNYGIWHNFNTGIHLTLSNGFDLFTLLKDDAFILPDFSKNYVVDYFNKNCKENDVLHINFVSGTLTTEKIDVDTGMTVSSYIARRNKFREDFVIDQLDIYFCYDVSKIGGIIKSIDRKMLDVRSVGRMMTGKMHYLPSFRVYLLTRNTLRIFIESKKIHFLLNFIKFSGGYLLKGIIGHEKRMFYACFSGVIDAMRGNFEISANLQKLSGNKFCQLMPDLK